MAAVIVCMPFASVGRPSLQAGLLAAIAREHGFCCDTLHLNLDLARQIGAELYEVLCRYRGPLVGEWLFSLEAFGDDAPDQGDRFLSAFEAELRALLPAVTNIAALFRDLRHRAIPAFLDHAAKAIAWRQYEVIGFTSTFQQNVASLAMARRLRSLAPGAAIVFGGANLEGPMGLETARAFAAVDYVVSGEGDEAWPELLTALAIGRNPVGIAGVIAHDQPNPKPAAERAPFQNLDANPVPDFSEFFDRAESLGLLPNRARRTVLIPFESSRGCWWGQKSHCTFCGLNGSTMQFRSKSPARVVQELQALAVATRSFDFEAVDNILDLGYLDSLFSQLAESQTDFRFFYEVKANLSRRQLATLKKAGVQRIQPGIESLSTHVLKLMGKGSTALDNINLLRWAMYYELNVSWNLLWGFPLEDEADCRSQTALLPSLVHLQPPEAGGRIWMERFSPIFKDRKRFPALRISPARSYAYVFPSFIDLDNLAYFFDYELEGSLPDWAFADLERKVAEWQAAWRRTTPPALTLRAGGDFLQIDDDRVTGQEGIFTFNGPLARIYLACIEQPMAPAKLLAATGLAYPLEEVVDALNRFCEMRLMVRERSRYLALALPATRGR